MQHSILVAEDEPMQREITRNFVTERLGLHAICVENGQEAIDYIKGNVSPQPDLVLMDIQMPGVNGLEALEQIRPMHPDLPIIMLTSREDYDSIVTAMRAGATDYIIKPFSQERLQITIQNMLRMKKLTSEVSRLQRTADGVFSFHDMVGESTRFKSAIALGERAADSDIPLLVLGESGSGKEMFARAVHGSSGRKGKPFVAVNCGAIPENLVESILFGHEKGAFTGAIDKAIGKFREAEGGTLFLDEIGELKLDHQVKLLRVLQEAEVQPVGGRDVVKVDVRIISATNRDLEQQVQEGTFRDDLYYRLNVFPVTVPSLRERREDILTLAQYFIARFALAESKDILGLSQAATALLQSHPWPGNIRQLENAVFRAVVLCDHDELDISDFPQLAAGSEHNSASQNDNRADAAHIPDAARVIPVVGDDGHMLPMDEIEQQVLAMALRHYNGQMSEIARRLGIGRSTLYRKLADTDSQASA